MCDFSQTLTTSEGYSGKGTATYPNGDTFKGDFVNGVSTIVLFDNAFSLNSCATELVNTLISLTMRKTLTKVSTRAHGLITSEKESVVKPTPELESTTVTGRMANATARVSCPTQIRISTLETGARVRKMVKVPTPSLKPTKSTLASS